MSTLPSSSSNPPGGQGGGEKPPFRVRPARRGDGDAISGLLRELGYTEGSDTATMHWVISHPELEIVVAVDAQDKAIGLMSLSHRPQLRLRGRIFSVEELVVTQAWRRRGVGRALLKHALERAHALSVKRVELVTQGPRSEYIREFYEACGFEESESLVLRVPKFVPRR